MRRWPIAIALHVAAWVVLAASASAAGCRGQTMLASWYGRESCVTRACVTASGQRFDPAALTAAHRILPFGTRLTLTRGQRRVTVTINDRGPARWTGRDLDLSVAAARAIGIWRAGTGRVCARVAR